MSFLAAFACEIKMRIEPLAMARPRRPASGRNAAFGRSRRALRNPRSRTVGIAARTVTAEIKISGGSSQGPVETGFGEEQSR